MSRRTWGASNLGGWPAVRVLALFLSSLNRKAVGTSCPKPRWETGAWWGGGSRVAGAWGDKVARHQSTESLSPNPGLGEKGVSELQGSPFVFSCVVLPFKCKEDAAQQEHLCSLGFCGGFVKCKCPHVGYRAGGGEKQGSWPRNSSLRPASCGACGSRASLEEGQDQGHRPPCLLILALALAGAVCGP